jgi:hypothetical protein
MIKTKSFLLCTFTVFSSFNACTPKPKGSLVKSDLAPSLSKDPIKVTCGSLEAMAVPQGKLSACQRYSGGSNGGCWSKDAGGKEWFVKADRTYPGLQSGGEIISARIYRALDYTVPDTAILTPDSEGPEPNLRRVAALKLAGSWSGASYELSNISNSPTFRQLRVFAAFLKDWDRLGNPSNTFVASEGSTFAMLDFGGTLGSRAQGGFKPDEPVVSNAIGGFGLRMDGAEILNNFKMFLEPEHPWLNLNSEDWQMAAAKLLQCLPNDAIDRFVDEASYPDPKDAIHMKQAIKNRRDSLAKESQKRSGTDTSTEKKMTTKVADF